MVKRLLTVGFGASNGGEFRVHIWDLEQGVVIEYLRETVPMITDNRGLIWWPGPWIIQFAERVKELMLPGDALGIYGWGADIAAVRGDQLLAVPHYAGILPQQKYQDLVSSVPKLDWHIGFNGAIQAAFQPLAQLAVLQDTNSDWLQGDTELMPVTDFIFGLISGTWGHDPVMAQSRQMDKRKCNSLVYAVMN